MQQLKKIEEKWRFIFIVFFISQRRASLFIFYLSEGETSQPILARTGNVIRKNHDISKNVAPLVSP